MLTKYLIKYYNKRPGFTIIESLIYIACCCFLSCLFSLFILQFHKTISTQLNFGYAWLSLYSAHDRIISDLQKALQKKVLWKKLSPDTCIWINSDNKENGWELKNNRLILINNNYSSTLRENITKLFFEYFFDNQHKLAAISCTIESTFNNRIDNIRDKKLSINRLIAL